MRTTWTGRRQLERRTVAIKAQARFYDGAPPLDCEMTDYSATGARIVFHPGFEPPAAFDLFVPARGETFHAMLRWKTPGMVGVEFVKAKDSTTDQRLSEMLVRLSQIEDELRALKAGAVLAQAGTAETPLPTPEPVVTVDLADHAALTQRVEKLEARNEEILRALKATLAMLGELRDANAPGIKAA